ncbi:MAG TPA: hypothetical protein VI653_01670 [Steroidobacteraceae bacterium]
MVSQEQIIKAAYRVSKEIGQEVERLVRAGRQASREELGGLYQKLKQHLEEESAKRIYNALVNALTPPPEQEKGSGSGGQTP